MFINSWALYDRQLAAIRADVEKELESLLSNTAIVRGIRAGNRKDAAGLVPSFSAL